MLLADPEKFLEVLKKGQIEKASKVLSIMFFWTSAH
jgi:hypothetical protein